MTKKNLLQRVVAILTLVCVVLGFIPAGSAGAEVIPEIPSFSVEVQNGTDIKVTIEKTNDADGYEVWITSDCGYIGYKNENSNYGGYWYNSCYSVDDRDYINAATIEEDGTAVRTVTIKNLSQANVSVKVRAYAGTHYTFPEGWDKNWYGYGYFCDEKTVKVTAQKTGYKTSYDFSKVKTGDTIKFGTYEQDYPVDGKDPIEWIVLEKKDDRLLVVSKYGLDCLDYNRTLESGTTWQASTIRKWLNKKFINAAFNKTEKNMIRKSSVKNKDNKYFGTDGGKNTKDKIFLLSMSDVMNKKYGFDSKKNAYDINRKCVPTDYAVAQGAWLVSEGDQSDVKGFTWWWLRTPGETPEYASFVSYSGEIDEEGVFTDYHDVTVRPAMYINLKSAQ